MCDCVCARVYVYTCTRIRNTTSCVRERVCACACARARVRAYVCVRVRVHSAHSGVFEISVDISPFLHLKHTFHILTDLWGCPTHRAARGCLAATTGRSHCIVAHCCSQRVSRVSTRRCLAGAYCWHASSPLATSTACNVTCRRYVGCVPRMHVVPHAAGALYMGRACIAC